ncbi:unnamed protein product [Cercospora beticola]|nr:unnamed protein product [Cercospora beticola]
MDVRRLRDIYDNILLAAAEDEARPHPTDTSPLQNVMIYCNEDRFQKRADGTWVDTVSQVIPIGGKECTAKDFTTMAYTMVPGRAVFENHPSQITICPWLFQWARQRKYKKYADMQGGIAKAWTKRTLQATLRALGREDGIDKMRLLDQTILHELTHTLVGGRSLDVKVAGLLGSEKSYGWKNCLALAKNGGMHPEDDKLPRTALDNADSLALFGLAVKLLREQTPLYVLENGGLTNRRP